MIVTEISPDTRALANRLLAVPLGGAISYADLSAAIGRDVRTENTRYLIYGAMRVTQREAGAIFANDRGKGYVRLSPDDAHKVGNTARSRVRRIARHATKQISAALARANAVAPESQRKANAELSALGLLEHVAKDRHVVPAETDEAPTPVAITARRFLERIGAKAAE
jgi:hypothetical protein